MHKHTIAILTTAFFLPASFLMGRSGGVISGKNSMPTNLATSFPSCGSCHSSSPNASVRMSLSGASSVSAGSSVSMQASVAGANSSSARGGFAVEASAGAFRAGTSTRVDTTSTGRAAITHSNSLQRRWSFTWQAPTTPGLVEMFGVGNAVNGDGKDRGDAWGWYGTVSTIPGAPHRVFVNDPRVVATGTGCVGADGHVPVLGIAKAPAIHGTWETEAYNLPPATVSIAILGLSNTQFGVLPLPLPLAGLGGGKCTLRVSLDVVQAAVTSGAGSGNGVAKIKWLLPNDSSLRGLKLYFQQMTVDKRANAFGFSFSNALSTTIQ